MVYLKFKFNCSSSIDKAGEGGSVKPHLQEGAPGRQDGAPDLGLCPPNPAEVASPFPIQIGEPAQVVRDDVVVLAARAGHNDHTLVISQLGDLLRGPGPTDLVETKNR